MNAILKRGASAWRSLMGPNTQLEKYLKRSLGKTAVREEAWRGCKQVTGRRFTAITSTNSDGSRVGVFLRGACDLPSMFLLAPLVRDDVQGTFCIYKQGIGVADSRVDVLLQSLDTPQKDEVLDLSRKLRLGPDYFRPILFENTFRIPEAPELGEFPKSVVVLSLAPNVVRTAYRHKADGWLVDPGGWWLNQSMDGVLSDLEVITWFRRDFQSAGRISLDDFVTSFGRLVTELRNRTGTQLIVLNVLDVDPGSRTHNYQLVPAHLLLRRKEFNLALVELSRQMDFHVLDVDRILKGEGVAEQVDFAHFPYERMTPIAREAYRIFKELEVL